LETRLYLSRLAAVFLPRLFIVPLLLLLLWPLLSLEQPSVRRTAWATDAAPMEDQSTMNVAIHSRVVTLLEVLSIGV
jgi:hypothetical protein